MLRFRRFKFYIYKNFLEITAVVITLLSILTVLIEIRYINIILAILTILLILSFFIYHNRVKNFYYISLTDAKHDNGWFGKGNFNYDRTNKCFAIEGISTGKDAYELESVYIYKNCLSWSDYEFNFDFKILNSCAGIVIRAIDLSNFIMLQINKKGIRPHIKINEYWAIFEAEPTNLKFNKELSPDEWHRCVINCERNTVYVKLLCKDILLFDRSWNIPSRLHIIKKLDNKEKTKKIIVPPWIPINLYNGSIGFRNSRYEKALIRDIIIKEL